MAVKEERIPEHPTDEEEMKKAFLESFHAGNRSIEDTIRLYYKEQTGENLYRRTGSNTHADAC